MFFAVPLAADVRAILGGVVDTLRTRHHGDRVRWVKPHNLHITLRFLGELLPDEVPELVAAVRPRLAEMDGFSCHTGAVSLFPKRRARVIAVEIDAAESLGAIVAEIEREVVRRGLPAERRRFHAHLTLGRLRDRPPPSLDDPGSLLPRATIAVNDVVLFQSDLRPDGPVYAALASIPLRADSR